MTMGRLLTAVVVTLTAGAAFPQAAGHNTLPTSGPAASERHETQPREEDPLLTRVDKLRRDLGDFAKRYKKARGSEQQAVARDAATTLLEMEQLLDRLKAAGTTTPTGRP